MSECDNLLGDALIRADKRILEDYRRRLLAGEPSKAAWWAANSMIDSMALSSRPPIMDAEPMTKDEIIYRRNEAIGMQWITIPKGFYDPPRLLWR
jgi:hypothetical protein